MSAPIELVDDQQKLRQIIEEMDGVIDSLRLSITYLVFDLEATKRENDQLRQMLVE